MLVFVYGTLKRGEPNHHLMEKVGNYIGGASIDGKYKLVIGTEYNIPFLIPSDQPSPQPLVLKFNYVLMYFLMLK